MTRLINCTLLGVFTFGAMIGLAAKHGAEGWQSSDDEWYANQAVRIAHAQLEVLRNVVWGNNK